MTWEYEAQCLERMISLCRIRVVVFQELLQVGLAWQKSVVQSGGGAYCGRIFGVRLLKVISKSYL